jgi:hypothetical protein
MENKNISIYEKIGHPSHVSAPAKDMKYILDNFWNNGYFNDHEPKERRFRIKSNDEIVGLAIWTNYRAIQVVPVFKGTFIINPLRVDKETGDIHLSTCTCGGTVIGGNVERFNKEMSPNNQDRPFGYGEHLDVFTREGWEKVKESPIMKKFFEEA